GTWKDPANWMDFSQQNFGEASVSNGGLSILDTGEWQGYSLIVGSTDSGRVRQTGGDLTLFDDDHNEGFLRLGARRDVAGTYELYDGQIRPHIAEVGAAGTGHLAIYGGEFIVDNRIAISEPNPDAAHTVEQHGGVLRSSRDQPGVTMTIGSSGPSNASYLMTGGLVDLRGIRLWNAEFIQTGGTVSLNETFSVSSLNGESANYQIMGHAILNAKTGVSGENAVLQRGGLIRGRTMVGSGTIQQSGGIAVDDLTIFEDDGSIVQSGGVRLTGQMEMRSVSSEPGSERETYELRAGFLRTESILLDTRNEASIVQTGGAAVASSISLAGQNNFGGSAVYILQGGRLFAGSELRVGEAGVSTGQLDLAHSDASVSTGRGSWVIFDVEEAFVNVENATLRLGPDSVLVTPAGVDAAGLWGNVEHHNAVLYHPGDDFVVEADQRVHLGYWSAKPDVSQVIIRGEAYVDATTYDYAITEPLRIENGGTLRMPRSHGIVVRDTDSSGVWNGTLQAGGLSVWGRSDSMLPGWKFTIMESSADLGGIGFDSLYGGSVQVESSQVQAGVISAPRQGERQLTLQQSTVEVGEISWLGAGSQMEVRDTTMDVGDLMMRYGSTLELADSTLRVADLHLLDARIVVDNSTMEIGNSFIYTLAAGMVDFEGTPGHVEVNDAVLNLGGGDAFRNSANATFAGSRDSLVILPPGVSANVFAAQFSAFDYEGLFVSYGTVLNLAADRTIRGSGSLMGALDRVHVQGTVVASPGQGIWLDELVVRPGAYLDLGAGEIAANPTSGNSYILGGEVHTSALSARGAGAEIVQDGGEVYTGTIFTTQEGTYSLLNGELHVQTAIEGDALNLDGGGATVVLESGAVWDLTQTFAVAEQNAHLVINKGALAIHDAVTDPRIAFGSYSGDGLLHERGTTLEVGQDDELFASTAIAGSVVNDGLIGPGNHVGGQLRVHGDYIQTSNGRLRIQVGYDASGTMFSSDDVSVSQGIMEVAGTLELEYANGYVPALRDDFKILYPPGNVIGAFDEIIFPEMAEGLTWDLDEYGKLTVVRDVASQFAGFLVGDLDGNGIWEPADVDLMVLSVRTGVEDTLFDLDQSGSVDEADLALLIESHIGTRFGDVNLDGRVDEADFRVWETHQFQEAAGWSGGDFNGDGVTDGLDFNHWLQNRGWVSPWAAAVPEPTGTFWVWILAVFLAQMRRQR
ncbi:MAG: hypothetical protein KDA60_13130, partial [Planctomycetales bacterium]|nr:hypothetical protein [Planctomycetales bacterium]